MNRAVAWFMARNNTLSVRHVESESGKAEFWCSNFGAII